jgi:hypothetical protein
MKIPLGLALLFGIPAYATEPPPLRPDDYTAVMEGLYFSPKETIRKLFTVSDCDYGAAVRNALIRCSTAGANRCNFLRTQQNQCRTKCNCAQ